RRGVYRLRTARCAILRNRPAVATRSLRVAPSRQAGSPSPRPRAPTAHDWSRRISRLPFPAAGRRILGMDTPDILVMGGGIIGCSLARELARVSKKVTVLDAGRAGGGASTAAAGLLTPSLATMPPGALVDLCHESAALYESWVQELRQDGAGDVGFRRA